MNLINRTNENEMDENNENRVHTMNENSMLNATADGDYTMNDSTMNESTMNNESRLLSDFSNNNDMLLNGGGGSMRKHRRGKHGQSKMDNYLQEPQFVTKRTSSGRLVKMKISTDYDYASDEEKETRKKRSKTSFDKKNFNNSIKE